MLIIGASGHGKVILETCREAGIQVSSFMDNDPQKLGELMGIPVILEDFTAINDNHVIIGIGDNTIRKNIAKTIEATGIKVQPFLAHPLSGLAKGLQIGEGTVIFMNAAIQVDSIIGKHCIINTSASIDHDCTIADFVHVAPNATLCGGISVGEGTFIGANATILPNVKIGKNCIVGAGSVLITDLNDNQKVVGNPARIIT
ncbi:MAG: acetyltransferase [Cyclobacteriaceae bacterium]|nr:acetyltransferase [Cyclobacteriaceae bacterium]